MVQKYLVGFMSLTALIAFSLFVFHKSSDIKLSVIELDKIEFDHYLKLHDKSYSHEEYSLRLKNFKANTEYIRNFNKEGNTWTLGANFLADLSFEEYKSTYLPQKFPKRTVELKPVYFELPQYPPTVDWRTKGAVTPVKNQLACGGCYGFLKYLQLKVHGF